ncbi:50S ribosomal protein L3 [Candidatus Woesebacteria bacterium RBG_16_34_12]|uniref:Large ribosomal subunit protein uL3 n=1 Tax=Candidatus Woesebacteria bacterium RBG_16_34_12 TaxID=1802480 RepID=A0A1F7XB32_9BACT|nr:MAG: 50S ribosomal protein L3 [Candidatus Woesebacteria bacterium RBG_16_34_12]
MLNALLGEKKQMSQTFIGDTKVPVTFIKVGPCVITQIKTKDKDGYWAIQLGYGSKKAKNISKPLKGHMKTISGQMFPRFLREVRLKEEVKVKIGDKVKVSDIFSKGDKISITGISKGKGFAGVVKRWKFAGGPKTHGQSDRQRAPGSIGQGTTPGRVRKGKKMAGRMGSETVTVKNLYIVDIDSEKDTLKVSGCVPGAPNSLLVIKRLGSGKLEELVKHEVEKKVVEEEENVKESNDENKDKSN